MSDIFDQILVDQKQPKRDIFDDLSDEMRTVKPEQFQAQQPASVMAPAGFDKDVVGIASESDKKARAEVDYLKENIESVVRPTPGLALAQGMKGAGGLVRQAGDLTGMEPLQRTGKEWATAGDAAMVGAREQYPLNPESWAEDVRGGLTSTVMQAPFMVAALPVAGVNATAATLMNLAPLVAITEGDAYDKYRNEGFDSGLASFGAGVEASIEGITEFIPMKQILKVASPVVKKGIMEFVQGALKYGGQEHIGETLATLGQDLTERAMAKPGATASDREQNMLAYFQPDPATGKIPAWENFKSTQVATATQNLLMGGVGAGAGMLANPSASPPRRPGPLQNSVDKELSQPGAPDIAVPPSAAVDGDIFDRLAQESLTGGMAKSSAPTVPASTGDAPGGMAPGAVSPAGPVRDNAVNEALASELDILDEMDEPTGPVVPTGALSKAVAQGVPSMPTAPVAAAQSVRQNDGQVIDLTEEVASNDLPEVRQEAVDTQEVPSVRGEAVDEEQRLETMVRKSQELQKLLIGEGYAKGSGVSSAGLKLVSQVAKDNQLRDWPDTQDETDYDALIGKVREQIGRHKLDQVNPVPPTPLDAQAHAAAASPANDRPEPSPAQIEAGNYKKGHVKLLGLDISIENPVGSTRKGTDETGRAWQTDLAHHYGYIKGTVGRDKDPIDVFVKPGIDESTAGEQVFVVDQKNVKTGKFDEHKVMVGFQSADEARAAYLKNYDQSGPGRIMAVTAAPVEEFKAWLKGGKTRQAFASQALKATAPPAAPKPNFVTLTRRLKERGIKLSGKQPDGSFVLTNRGDGTEVHRAADLLGVQEYIDKTAVNDDGLQGQGEKRRQGDEVAASAIQDVDTFGVPQASMDFINQKVAGLGSIEAVAKAYGTDSSVDRYARSQAERVFGNGVEMKPVAAPLKAAIKPVRKKTTKETSAGYGSSNQVFTADRADAARALLRKKLSQLSAGIDPEMVQAGIELAGFHIEAGARSFAAYSKVMVEELGEAIRPFLRSFYAAVRNYPGFDAKGMESDEQLNELEALAKVEATVPKKVKTKGQPRKLQGDYGVKSIDGYSDAGARAKELFLNDAKGYLRDLAKVFQEQGWETEKPNVNAGGVAGSGDASLIVFKPGSEYGGYVTVGGGMMLPLTSASPSGVRFMYRATTRKNKYTGLVNRWDAPWDASTAELAALMMAEIEKQAPKASETATAPAIAKATANATEKSTPPAIAKTTETATAPEDAQGVESWRKSYNRKYPEKNGHFASGYAAFMNNEPRTVPSYFTQPSNLNAKAWLFGWDAAQQDVAAGEMKTAKPRTTRDVFAARFQDQPWLLAGFDKNGEFERSSLDLTPEERRVEEEAIAQITADPEGAIDKYLFNNHPIRTMGENGKVIERHVQRTMEQIMAMQPVVVNTDDARTLFQPYRDNPGKFSAAVHEPSSAIAKMVWQKALTVPDPRKINQVLFLGGGGGSGKSSAMQDKAGNLFKIREESQIIYDGTLNDYNKAVALIAAAKAAGKREVYVTHVYSPTEKAVRQIVKRKWETAKEIDGKLVPGRDVPPKAAAHAHYTAGEVFLRLANSKALGIKTLPIDNSGEYDPGQISLEKMQTLVDNKVGGMTLEQYENRVREIYEQNDNDPTINPTKGDVDGTVRGMDAGGVRKGRSEDQGGIREAGNSAADSGRTSEDGGAGPDVGQGTLREYPQPQAGEITEDQADDADTAADRAAGGTVPENAGTVDLSGDAAAGYAASVPGRSVGADGGLVSASLRGSADEAALTEVEPAGAGGSVVSGSDQSVGTDAGGVSGLSGQPRAKSRGRQRQSGRATKTQTAARPVDGGLPGAGSGGDGVVLGDGTAADGAESNPRRDGSGTPAELIKKNVTDLRIPVGGLERSGSWRATASRNLDIIELIRKLDSDNRLATPEEQQLLMKYVGWGASEIRNKLFPGYAYYGRLNVHQADAEWKPLVERAETLFSPDDLKTAARSSQYAHYTSEAITRSIWAALQRLGFAGGKVFEPGMGTGNFAGTMPDTLYASSRYTGIEFDNLTASIAKHLYPAQNIIHGDYTRQKFPGNFFDVAIGNPPFSQTKILVDPEYKKYSFALHDYFFAKTIDKVRPGGLLVFVTSRYTMDKQGDKARKYLAERADLVGAIRLPQTAFKQHSGTEVVTDVLFLRKRADGEISGGADWLKLDEVKVGETTHLINEYFSAHPEMVLGRHSTTGTMYAKDAYTVEPLDGDIEQHFADAVENLPANVYSVSQQAAPEIKAAVVERDFNPKHNKEGGIYLSDTGALMRVEFGSGVPLDSMVKLSAKDAAWLTDYVPLRDLMKQARYDQFKDGDWEKSLKALNKAYAAFVKKHGEINAFTVSERTETDEDGVERKVEYRRYKWEKLANRDVEGPLVWSLERVTEDGEIVKGAFLQGRTIAKPVRQQPQSMPDALAVSLDELGALDLDHIGALMNVPREEVFAALGNLVFETPSGTFELADEYLAGDVVAKLAEAEAAAAIDTKYQRNVKALLDVQPKPLGPAQVSARLGMPWIPAEIVAEFAQDVLDVNVTVSRHAATNTWKVDMSSSPSTGWSRRRSARAPGAQSLRSSAAEWGTSERGANEILDAVLNQRPVKITTKDKDGKTYTDAAATARVNEIADKMKEAFRSWVWTDAERAGELLELYNRKYNNIAPRRFDGSHLTLPGLSTRRKLHAHQKRAIWRMIQDGNTYLAHAVGAGKTLEMIAAGMEMKRLGMIAKPMYVVPNDQLGQWAAAFLDAYPLANIMVADEENFHTSNRRRFMAQAAMNAPDAIIITQSSLGKLRLKRESVDPVRSEILADLRIAQEEAKDDGAPRYLISKMEKMIEAAEQRFDSVVDDGKGDNVLTFEDLGVDFLIVDEAHAYRKLDFTTVQQLKGVDPSGSRRTLDLYLKVKWLEHNRPGRSHVFASGTPVTNTMGELYNVMRFFMEDQMERDDIKHFDAWAAMFGETSVDYELNAAGRYEPVTRFAKFNNLPELMKRVRSFMDVLTSSNLGAYVKRPDVKGGAPRQVIAPPSTALKSYQTAVLQPRMEASKKWKPSKQQPGNPDPIINIITDGRLSSIDMRYVDPGVKNDPGSKLNLVIDEIIRIYKLTKKNSYNTRDGKPSPIKGGAQVVFYNHGFGENVAKNRGFDGRAWINQRLKAAGIPLSEVAWFDEYDTGAKKLAVQKDVREGRKKIIIGHAKALGVGKNLQTRLYALHYIDPPWYPADVEQPHGRIIRQGNQNEEVEINWYATKGSYDSTMWQMVGRKGRFIEQAFMGDDNMRSMEDLSEVSQYEMARALSSGDERIIKLVGLQGDVERLHRLREAHFQAQTEMRQGRKDSEFYLRSYREQLEKIQKAEKVVGNYVSIYNLKGIVGKQEFTKSTEFGEAVMAGFDTAMQELVGTKLTEKKPLVSKQYGSINGVPLVAVYRKSLGQPEGLNRLEITEDVAMDVDMDLLAYPPGTDSAGLVRRIINRLNDVSSTRSRLESQISEEEGKLAAFNKKIGAPFEHQQALNEKVADLAQLQAELTAEGEKPPEPAAPVIDDAAAVGDQPMMMAGKGSVGVALSNEEFDAIFRRITARLKDADGFTVVATARDLPARIVAEIKKQGGRPEDIDGVFHNGRVYIVREHVTSQAMLEEIVFHEWHGHAGLYAMFGNDKDKLRQAMLDLYAKFTPGELLRFTRKYNFKLTKYAKGLREAGYSDDERHATLMEELLVFMTNEYSRGGIAAKVREIIGMIRSWLRENGFVRLSEGRESDIAFLLKKARAYADAGTWAKDGPAVEIDGAALLAQLNEMGVTNEMLTQFMAGVPRFAAAWHGSPKRGIEKFDKAFIGTGEGAQAFGYGHYFSTAKEIANHYREVLSGNPNNIPMSDIMDWLRAAAPNHEFTKDEETEIYYEILHKGGRGRSLQYRNRRLRDVPESILDEAIARALASVRGGLYRVELAPEEDEYLRWDLPLSEQSEKVKAALNGSVVAGMVARKPEIARSGNDLYRAIGRFFLGEERGAAQRASDYLHSLGIRGIKYPAETLTGNKQGDGTAFNYVVFDDADIEITARFHLRNTAERISPLGAVEKMKGLLNPLDYSRLRKTAEKRLSGRTKHALGFLLQTPYWKQAEADKAAVPFYEEGRIREEERHTYNIRMRGGQAQGGKVKGSPWQRFKDGFNWTDEHTVWEEIKRQVYNTLTNEERAALDVLVVEGDARNVEYGSLGRALLNPTIKAAGVNGKVFFAYQALMQAKDKAFDIALDIEKEIMVEAGVDPEKIEKSIAEKRQMGKAKVEFTTLEEGENLTVTLSRDQATVNVVHQLRKVAKAFGTTASKADSGDVTVVFKASDAEAVREALSHVLANRIRGHMHRDHGEGEHVVTVHQVIDRLDFEEREITTKGGKPAVQMFLPYYPGRDLAEKIEEVAGSLGGSFLQLDGKGEIIVTFREAEAENARQNLAALVDGKKPRRVMVYSRYVETEHAANELKAEVEKNLAKAMPINFRKGASYEVSSAMSESIREEEYQAAVTGSYALDRISEETLKKMVIRGEIGEKESQGILDEYREGLAETLLARGAGATMIRRVPYLIEGYERGNVMGNFEQQLNGTAGMLSKAVYALRQYKHLQTVPTRTRRWAVSYIENTLRNMGRADRLSGDVRALASLWYLGGNLTWMLINHTQPYVFGVAELSRHIAEGKLFTREQGALRRILTAEKDILARKQSAEEKGLWADPRVQVQIEETVMAEMAGSDSGVGGKVSQSIHTAARVSMAHGHKIEVLNRKVVILAAYRTFRAQGLVHAQALDRALEVNSAVNIDMGRYNLPGFAAKSSIGRTLYTLQSFVQHAWNYLYYRSTSGQRADQKAVLRLLFAMALLGGLPAGAPGSDELNKLILKWFGYSPKLALRGFIRKFAKNHDTAGELLEDFVWHGIPGTFGVSLTGAVQFRIPIVTNVIDGDTGFRALGGAVGGLAEKGLRGIEAANKGDYGRALENVAPTVVANAMSATRQMTEGVKTAHGKPTFYKGVPLKMTGSEASRRSVGMQPARTADISETRGYEIDLRSEWSGRRQEALDRYRQTKALKHVQEFNKALRASQAAALVPLITPETMREQWKPNKRQTQFQNQYGID